MVSGICWCAPYVDATGGVCASSAIDLVVVRVLVGVFFFPVAVADQQLPLSVVENVCGRRLRELATCMQALLIYFTRKQRRPTQCDANKRVITRFTRKNI
jgi:hypothetical protein